MEIKLREEVRRASFNVAQMSKQEITDLFERIVEHLEFEQQLIDSAQESRTKYLKLRNALRLVQLELSKKQRIQNVRELAPVIDKALAPG